MRARVVSALGYGRRLIMRRSARSRMPTLLTDVKKMIRERTGRHELVLTPRVVGWAVAGFYEGMSSKGGS